jgi:predicted small secreted protein
MKSNTITILSGATFAILSLTGCNTFEGIGEDVSKGGSAIAHAASETGAKITGNDQDTKTTEVKTHTADGTKKTTITTATKTTKTN